MDLSPHFITQRSINHLVLLYHVFSNKALENNHRLEMVPVTAGRNARTGQSPLNHLFDVFWLYHSEY